MVGAGWSSKTDVPSIYWISKSFSINLLFNHGLSRHGKSGDPGSWKILQIAEDLNKNIK